MKLQNNLVFFTPYGTPRHKDTCDAAYRIALMLSEDIESLVKVTNAARFTQWADSLRDDRQAMMRELGAVLNLHLFPRSDFEPAELTVLPPTLSINTRPCHVKQYVMHVIAGMKTGVLPDDDDIRASSWAVGVMIAGMSKKKRASLISSICTVFVGYSDRRQQDEHDGFLRGAYTLADAFVDSPLVRSEPITRRSNFVGV